MGQPIRRVVIPDKPKEEDYFYANPQECLCESTNCDDLLGHHNSTSEVQLVRAMKSRKALSILTNQWEESQKKKHAFESFLNAELRNLDHWLHG